jgi:hypothetical protein
MSGFEMGAPPKYKPETFELSWRLIKDLEGVTHSLFQCVIPADVWLKTESSYEIP